MLSGSDVDLAGVVAGCDIGTEDGLADGSEDGSEAVVQKSPVDHYMNQQSLRHRVVLSRIVLSFW